MTNLDFKIRVVGLGHPIRWHCSLNTDFATEKEATDAKIYLETVIEEYESAPRLPASEINRKSTPDEIAYMQKAVQYYKDHSNDSKFILWRKIKELEEIGVKSQLTEMLIKELRELYDKSW